MKSLSGIRAVIAAAAVASVAATAPAAWQAGLVGGKVSGAFNVADYPAETDVYLCPHAATNNDTTANGVWYNCVNTTWVYTGQVYLAGATTFAENIDDSVRLLVGGTQILDNSAWNTPTYGTFTPEAPGWHSFELRLGNGSGGAGPVAGNGWTATKGFGMASGTITSNQGGDYEIPIDPGDRTLFRHDDGLGFDDTFTISGVPSNFGTPVPFYGVYAGVANGSNLTMSVASGTEYVTASDTQRACCTGYVWYAVDAGTSTKTVVQSGGETSFAYSHSNMAEIAWLWKVENLVTVAAGIGGSVSTNGGWGDHVADTLTITATPSEGYSFYQWTGEIDEAQRLNPTITVDFAVARSLTAAFGGIYYLSPDGDDANDGLSWPQAFLTLSNAVVQAGGGSTIRVTNGTYQVDSEITISKGLAVVGVADAAQTIIKQKPAGVPQGNGTHFGFNMLKLDHADASLEGLTLTGVVIDGDYNARKGAVTITQNGGTVRNCIFINNRSVTYYTEGVGAYMYSGLIDNCYFTGNTNSTSTQKGIVCLSGGTVQNCIFTGNECNGGMIYVEDSTLNAVVRNCTITRNYTPASCTRSPGLYLARSSANYAKVLIENTIVYGNIASGSTAIGFPNWTISNTANLITATNSFRNCLTTDAPNGTCIDADPEFAGPANGDFTLLAASPCIDAGYANGLVCDYAGAARPSGAGIDIGAYEYDQSSLSAGFTADTLAAQAGTAFTLEATVRGPFDPGDLVYAWAITNTATGAGTVGSESSFTFSDPSAGFYTVALTVTDNGQTPPAVATHAKEAYIMRSAAVMYVKPGNEAGEAFPYDTVANAAARIPTAYALAIDGTTIRLEPGIHEITVQLIVEKGVTFIGDGSGAVIKQVTNGERVIYMDHADARFENVAITGGRKGSSSALGGPIPYARYQHGCGVRIGISGGTLYNCAVTNNSFTEYYVYGGGVGMLAGRVDRCLIADNKILSGSLPASGAGVYLEGSALLENSVIVGNSSLGEGAVYVESDNAVVRNCTIQGNQSSGSYSGGLYFIKGLALNCAIYGNTSAAYGDVGPAAALTSANIRYCATVDGSGADAVACRDPQFTDAAGRDFTFAAGSDLLDAGLAYEGAAAALDFAGHARVSGAAIDIGAYEYDTSVAACGIAVAPTTEYLEGGSVTLTAVVVGGENLSGVSYSWTLTDTYGVQTNAGVSPVTLNLAAGTYDVALSVSGGSLGTPLTELQPRLLHVVAPKIYGNPANAAQARYPWDTPATAATDLSLLVAEAIDGTEIHLAAGTFTTTNVLEVTRGMKVIGDAGRDATVVTTANTTHRLLWMSHADARVERITFSGCRSVLPRYASGGVIHVTPLGGTLYDCRMTLCTNNVYNQIGQLYAAAGLVDRCLFDRNKASNSNSSYNNTGLVVLGGTAKLRNSVIADNTVDYGGGLYFTGAATAENCTIIGNTATVQGGGVYTIQSGSRIRNCIIRGNASPKSGSATDNADLYTNQNAANQLLMFRNVCTPLAIGTACETGDPLIKDAARGNYGIAPASPCRNAGLTDTWMADARDYAGNARLVDKIVDIGACETLPSGTLFLIR